MSIEIEKKYRLTAEQRQYVENELASVAASFIGEEFEENTIYGGGVLDTVGGVVRLRRTESKNTLTFKRRVEGASDAKHQIEYESEISSPDEVAAILAELKMSPRVIYEKRRRTWKFRQVEIVVDELPFGRFMEIEGSITGIKEAEMILGIEDLEVEYETYPRMAARSGIEKDGIRESRFLNDS